MNVGSLATVAVVNPPNLAILCIDNGHYGETGYQLSHTSLGVDLTAMAQGAGIVNTHTVENEDDVENGARMLRESNGSSFVLMRVAPTPPPTFKRELDPAVCRTRFETFATRRAVNRGAIDEIFLTRQALRRMCTAPNARSVFVASIMVGYA